MPTEFADEDMESESDHLGDDDEEEEDDMLDGESGEHELQEYGSGEMEEASDKARSSFAPESSEIVDVDK